MKLNRDTGFIDEARVIASPNCDAREGHSEPEAVIVHCISLPPGEYGGSEIVDLFCNQLDETAHDYFKQIAHLRVSSHFLIRRGGQLIQFVSTRQRAWHAGESICLGKPKANDFTIGIELEGLDTDPQGYTDAQYQTLQNVSAALHEAYPQLGLERYFAHSDIAPGRKTDPGPYFDWGRLL